MRGSKLAAEQVALSPRKKTELEKNQPEQPTEDQHNVSLIAKDLQKNHAETDSKGRGT